MDVQDLFEDQRRLLVPRLAPGLSVYRRPRMAEAATSLPDSIVGRRMACQSDIHVAALGGRRGDCLSPPPYMGIFTMESVNVDFLGPH